MQYFKNSEIAYTYHVSVRTVRNWIEAAKAGKVDLDLYEHNGKQYVSNTTRNIATLQQIIAANKKFRPHRAVDTVEPKPEFYKLYSEPQIYDIFTNLVAYRELPRQYNYFDGGAKRWDEYGKRLAQQESPNAINSTVRLLSLNEGYLEGILEKYKRVNVVDVGVGNAWPVKGLLARFLEQGKLGRYIALDISPDILQIARKNIKTWFGGGVAFEGHEVDITREGFSNLLAKEYIKDDAQETANLILVLGGTLGNMRSPDAPLRLIHDSMSVRDFLVYTKKLDSEGTRRYFDFNEPGESTLPPIHRFAVDLLNIDPNIYDIEIGYDERTHQRYERIRLKKSVNIKFKFDEGERTVSLDKGEAILVWRSWQQSSEDVAEQLKRNDFYILNASQTADKEYLLAVAEINRD